MLNQYTFTKQKMVKKKNLKKRKVGGMRQRKIKGKHRQKRKNKGKNS